MNIAEKFNGWCLTAASDSTYEIKPGVRVPLPLLSVLMYAVCDGDGRKFQQATKIMQTAFEAGYDRGRAEGGAQI